MARKNILMQELDEVERGPRAWRHFGLVIACVLIVLAAVSCWKHGVVTPLAFALTGCALVMTLAGLLFPKSLDRMHLAWMFLSLCMGWVMSRVILVLLFVLIVIPTHIVGRLFGLSFMELRRGREQKSLWKRRKPRERKHHEKLF